MYGFPEAIFKMLAIEKHKDQNSDFPSSSFHLSPIYNIYLQMYTFESDKS